MQKLYETIAAFEIDEPGSRAPFVKRLARENGWTLDYATRVVFEYKRFIYLAMTSPNQVTPSEDVDQAWHLHLTFTVSYWQRMTPLLPRPLHHIPSLGGKKESSRFDHQYDETIAVYQQTFGEPAPSDIWPLKEKRFGHDLKWQRVNTTDHWVIDKRKAKRITAMAGVAALGVTVAGCSTYLAQGSSPSQVGVIIAIFLGILIVAGLIHAAIEQRGTNPNQQNGGTNGCGSSGCSSTGCGTSSSDSGSDSGGGDSGGGDSGCGGGGCGGGGCGGGGCSS